jgi:malonyl-CoA/methylmalonyl-CoA synthetase
VKQNLYNVLSKNFPENENAPCLILPDNKVITYGELDKESARMANILVNKFKVEPGDRVAVQIRKSPYALFLYLGVLRTGAIYLPMNDAYQKHEVEYFLKDAKPKVFFCNPEKKEISREMAGNAGVPFVQDIDEKGRGYFFDVLYNESDKFNTFETDAENIAAILYTSGTTGRPKGAMLSHKNLIVNAKTLHSYWEFQPGDILLHMLPIYHVHGLFVANHCALLNGSPIFFEPKFDVKRAIELLPKSTVFMGVPTYYVRLLMDENFTADVCRNMRLFISGSAPLLPETFEKFKKRTGHTILERYGMTEGGMFASNPYKGLRKAGTVGFPLPGVSIRIVNDEGKEVGVDEVGYIQVKGDNIFKGYWGMPEKTKEEFTEDGYFKTGDMGKWDKDGYLSIVGRSKDLIITGGLNVYPKEIEEIIDRIPGVFESAVVGIPHPDFGEAVTAFVVRKNDDAGKKLTSEEIISLLKKTLANFKVPKSVIFIEELPRNSMGKVQKNVLREKFSTLFS